MPVKKSKKPRRWWVTMDADDVIHDSFGSKKDALDDLSFYWKDGMKVVLVEEVMPKKKTKGARGRR